MEPQSTVTAEEFFKVELRVGRVLEATTLENSEKLIRLSVDFGGETRTVLTGLLPFYDTSYFPDKLFVFAYNLEPRKMAGELSEGMLMCVDADKPLPLEAPDGANAGDNLK